jgi:PAS domain S-box-containing protein
LSRGSAISFYYAALATSGQRSRQPGINRRKGLFLQVRVPMSSRISGTSFAPYLARVVGVAAAYVVTAQGGLSLGALGGVATAVWPPSGISLAALLLGGYRLWPGITAGAVLANLLIGAPVPTALAIGGGNTIEALLGAFLLQEVAGVHKELDCVRDVMGLVGLAALLSTLVGATIGTTSAWFGGLIPSAMYREGWFTWWVGDAVGDLTVAPLMLTWGTPPRARGRRGTSAELAFLLLVLAASCGIVFGWLRRPAAWAVFPFTIWAALRFGQRGATATVFVAAGIAIWATAQGAGPFAGVGLREDLMLLQLLLGVLSVTGLTLAAVLSSRESAEDTLRAAREQLRIVTDTMSAAVIRCSADLRYVWVSKAFADWVGRSPEEIAGRPIVDVVGEEAVDLFRPGVERVLAGERVEHEQAVRFLGSGRRWINEVCTPTHDPNGAVDGWVGVLTDLTARKGIEQTLADALEERTRAESLLRQARSDLERRVRERTAQLQASNERLSALSARILTLQDQERRRIARELHDSTAQHLAGVAMNLARVQRSAKRLSMAAQEALTESLTLVDQCLGELRTLSYLLHPPLLDEVGLAPAVRWYAEGFSKRSGINVEVTVAPDLGRMPPPVEQALFRIVQECLGNVHRHAESPVVRVWVLDGPDAVRLRVEDEGQGIPPETLQAWTGGEAPVGLGLMGMRERVEQLGGRFEIRSSEAGTVVEAVVPLAKRPEPPGAERRDG